MSSLAWGLVAHSHEAQKQQLTSVLQDIGLSTQCTDQLSDLVHLQAPLGSIWVIFDSAQGAQSSIDQAYIEQLRRQPASVFWGILILGQAKEEQKQNWLEVGADAYLSYPFDRHTLLKQIRMIIDQRTPLSYYNILPAPLANALDKMSLKLSELSYYELLEVPSQVSMEELQQRFHQRSLFLHPDRHRNLKQSHLSVYNKVNEIYKRILEAYRVLSDPMKRSMYNTLLPQGNLRWNTKNDQQIKALLKISSAPIVQNLLAEAMSSRSQGQLLIAYQKSQQALQQEPENELLQNLCKNYQKLIQIIARDHSLKHLIPAEFIV